jgi:hypothetical protein
VPVVEVETIMEMIGVSGDCSGDEQHSAYDGDPSFACQFHLLALLRPSACNIDLKR